jgi:hypothetical protein
MTKNIMRFVVLEHCEKKSEKSMHFIVLFLKIGENVSFYYLTNCR